LIQAARDQFRHAARWARRPLQSKALILLYHRVSAVRPDPWSLSVTPEHFGEHLAVLHRHASVIRLEDLVRRLVERQPLRRAVAITFDDGYADNLQNARPLLEKYDLPATVFVVSGVVGQAGEFWWDELARLLLEPGSLPNLLVLCIGGVEQSWNLGSTANYSAADALRDEAWIAWGDDYPTARHRLYRELWEKMLPLREEDRQRLLNDLRAWAQAGPSVRSMPRAITPDELSSLARDGLVEIGAHTVTHPRLAALPIAEQRTEIRRSKASLEDLGGKPVNHFSYPFGRRTDYGPETVALVNQSGCVSACSNFADWVTPATDLFQLPRVNVPDGDGETFARYLANGFGLG
jgi:peptidoglycan/xylan/chitin deacetylase (PgdA/CDA1 family)